MSKKILNGIVVSDKPDKTITVLVERKYQHAVLKKVIKAKKKYSVHDEDNKLKMEIRFPLKKANLIQKIKNLKLLENLNDTSSN